MFWFLHCCILIQIRGQFFFPSLKEKPSPLVNDEILAEYREVLSRKRLKISAELAESVLTRLAACCLNIADASSEYPEVTDPKDRCFYAVTMSERESEDALLVTGNIRHFPVKPYVVTPAQFVEILQKSRK